MKAVISVFGMDMVGILAKVTGTCAKYYINILEVTQSILDKYFAMMMLADMEDSEITIEGLQKELKEELPGMEIHVMHEDIFNSMHRV